MTSRTIIVALTLGVATPALAQKATYIPIPNTTSASDMTPDGSIIVGTTLTWEAYYYTEATGVVNIGGGGQPGGGAVAVSDDGSVILGNLFDENDVKTAGIWTEADGWVSLGGLDQCDFIHSSAYELSADGTIATGLGWLGCSGQGFRWTEPTGMTGLEMLWNGNNRASAISADGSVMAGFAQGNVSRTPAVWFADGTGMVFDPDVDGEVRGMSDDGSILVGNWDYQAFTYSEENGLQRFEGIIPAWNNIAMDIADDEGTVVGFDSLSTNRQAWISPQGTGATRLTTYLADHGAENVPVVMQVCQAITPNGRKFCGHGIEGSAENPFGFQGWIVTLCPEPDLSGDCVVGFDDLVSLLADWGPCGDPCDADLDGDGMVGFSDLVILLAAWD